MANDMDLIMKDVVFMQEKYDETGKQFGITLFDVRSRFESFYKIIQDFSSKIFQRKSQKEEEPSQMVFT